MAFLCPNPSRHGYGGNRRLENRDWRCRPANGIPVDAARYICYLVAAGDAASQSPPPARIRH
jgi:hypothetical protein